MQRAASMALQLRPGLMDAFVHGPLYGATPDTTRPFETVLVTAPHDAVDPSIRDTQRDPYSGAIARSVHEKFGAAYPSELCIARAHRSVGDQNRMHGLLAAADMIFALAALDAADMSRVLHLDVHTYDKDRPMPGWCDGINIILPHGDEALRRVAARIGGALQRRIATRIVEMERRPVDVRDEDSNALIDWTRHRGATSLLLEFPTRQTQPACSADDAGWECAHGFTPRAFAQAVYDAVHAPVTYRAARAPSHCTYTRRGASEGVR